VEVIVLNKLEEYYNKFNEDKRLLRKHGNVEYITSMKYIKDYLKAGDKVIDIGAGTGRYSIALAEEGYDVTAVELVKHNLSRLKVKCKKVKAYQGNALNLSKFEDEEFDITILFGPMYHLLSHKDKVTALSEASRVTKKGGKIFVAYIMNEFSIITYGFKENNILKCIEEGKITDDFRVNPKEEDLYDYVRLEDIEKINSEVDDINRVKIISADGPADYLRPVLNKMDDKTYEAFIAYHLATCERMELLGASAHVVDILEKK
jgi:ubiquinone/menaquinone biosynthesis C-methylase UbiE